MFFKKKKGTLYMDRNMRVYRLYIYLCIICNEWDKLKMEKEKQVKKRYIYIKYTICEYKYLVLIWV